MKTPQQFLDSFNLEGRISDQHAFEILEILERELSMPEECEGCSKCPHADCSCGCHVSPSSSPEMIKGGCDNCAEINHVTPQTDEAPF